MGSFKGKQFLTSEFQSDVDFIESIQLPPETTIETQEQWETFLKITIRLTSILGKFHRARATQNQAGNNESTDIGSPDIQIELRSKVEAQKQTIQDQEREIINLRDTLSLVTEAGTGLSVFGQAVYVEPTHLEEPVNKTQSSNLELIHSEIFAQLESKVKSTLNFEIATAIKKSTESICAQTSCIEEMEKKMSFKDDLIRDLSRRLSEIQTTLNRQISDEQSKISSLNARTAEAERKLSYETSDKNLALNKMKELDTKLKESERLLNDKNDEYTKLKTKISNQTKNNCQQQQALVSKCNEIKTLKAKTIKYEMLLSEKGARTNAANAGPE